MARHSTGAWFRKSKSSWYAKVAGKQIPLGVKGIENGTAAQQAWHLLMANGAIQKTKPEPKRVEIATVFSVITGFLIDVKGRVKPNTYATYAGLLEPFVSHFSDIPTAVYSGSMLIAYATRPEWGPSYRHNLIGSVQTAFKWAETNNLIEFNPLKSVKRPQKASRGRKAIIRAEDHIKLMASASPSLKLLLTVLHETGARPGELARLSSVDVDFNTGVAILCEHKTVGSTGKPRLIVLTMKAKEILLSEAQKFPEGPLLRNSHGTAWSKDGIGLAIRRACKKSGVKAIAYGYRHTFATDALANGVPDATVAALLGHSSTTMLFRHYSHLTSRTDVLRQAAAVVRDTIS